jgi:lysophospholipase L1-like esterase
MAIRGHHNRRSFLPLALAASLVGLSVIAAMPPAGASSRLIGEATADRPALAAGSHADRASSVPPAAHDRTAPVVVTLNGGAMPARPVVTVPEPEPEVIVGPGPGATAVFLGDSFTSGWNGAGLGARGWPRLAATAREWRAINLAVAGTGFLNPGWTNQPIGSLVSRAIKSHPDVIVLAAGHNDSRWSSSATARAADKVIDRLRAGAPDALLVIVAPIWQSGSPPQRCLALRDHLRRKSAEIGAVFIDPLADGWFSGRSHRLIGPDGLHPTDAGHRFIAEHVLAGLAGA